MRGKSRSLALVLAAVGALVPVAVWAAPTPTLNQTVNPGTLSTDILQNDGSTPVASPTVTFSAVNKSFNCQTNTATLGDTNNKVYVTNLANNNGWTLTMAATSGAGTPWNDGTNNYSFDDPTSTGEGTGCANGQLTVDPSGATLTLDCNSVCVSTGITQGSSTAYNNGTVDSVTLMQDANGDAWKGYLTGIGLSQKIPGGQSDGAYSLGMTITVTAN